MELTWSWIGGAGALLGLVSLLVAGILLRWGNGRPAPLVLGAHFTFTAWAVLVPSASILLDWRLPPVWVSSTWVATILWQATLLAFPTVYPHWSFSTRRRWLLVWALIPAAMMLLVSLTAPRLLFTPDGGPTIALIRIVWWMNNLMIVVGLVVFARHWISAPSLSTRRAVLYVLLAYSFYALNHVFLDVAHATGRAPSLGTDVPLVNLVLDIVILGLLVCLSLFAMAKGLGENTVEGDRRTFPVVLLAILPLPALQLLYPEIIRLFGFGGTGYEALFFHLFLDGIPSILLFYGVIRRHIFDIDLWAKVAIKRSTVAAVFVGAFFVTAQIAQAFLTTEYCWAIGGLVAGLLLLAINPLQRLSTRVADKAMPNVQDTEEYRTIRKHEIYQTALEEALADGELSAKDRSVLAALQDQLGITAKEALHLERILAHTKRVA